MKGNQLFYSMSLAMQLGFLVVFCLGGFMLLGIWADSYLNTSPWLTLLGVFLGLGVTVYEVYHLLDPILHEDKK